MITPQTSGGEGPWAPGILKGMLLRRKDGLRLIYLECFWSKRFDVFVAFHELGHYFAKHNGLMHQYELSLAGEKPDWSNAAEEAEADLFSTLCTGRTR